ncbi:Alpha/Beta hydrolase protein [Xylariaceae sp. FL1651]|nr:Alpha/Beta hydrolase protein [Xylariaceae sp. FL1651]
MSSQYDLRGFGAAADAPVITSLEQLADDLLCVLDQMSTEKTQIIGTSRGGSVAQVFALRNPSRTYSIAILASLTEDMLAMLDRAEAAEERSMEASVSPTLQHWLLPDTIASNSWMVRYARTCVRRTKVGNWAVAWRALAALDINEGMRSLQVLALDVGGKQDISTPPVTARMVADLP